MRSLEKEKHKSTEQAAKIADLESKILQLKDEAITIQNELQNERQRANNAESQIGLQKLQFDLEKQRNENCEIENRKLKSDLKEERIKYDKVVTEVLRLLNPKQPEPADTDVRKLREMYDRVVAAHKTTKRELESWKFNSSEYYSVSCSSNLEMLTIIGYRRAKSW